MTYPRHLPYVECARYKNLVYARTLKCASEFFYRNFVQTAGWKPILYKDINWDQDTVFSYIMDPIKRRHKGISEFIVANDLKNLLFNDKRFQRTIEKVVALDEHSASLHSIYSKDIEKIHWILLEDNHQKGIQRTNQWLESKRHPPINWNYRFVHTTSNYLDEIYHEIKNLWEEGTIPTFVKHYLEKDIELYQRLKKIHENEIF